MSVLGELNDVLNRELLTEEEKKHKRLLIGNCSRCYESQARLPFDDDDSHIATFMEIHMRKHTCSCGGSIDKWIIINEFGIIVDVDIRTYRLAYQGAKRRPGRPPVIKKPERKDLKRLYVTEGKSIREVAAVLGCTKDTVSRTLQEHGIERRAGVKRSRLKEYRPAELRRRSRQEGAAKVAQELGVAVSTLRYYMKK